MVSEKTKLSRQSKSLPRSRARVMRHEPTDAEKKFWFHVRDRKFGGYKFKRQFLLGPYIVDFVCLEEKLIVELDGDQQFRPENL